MFKMFQSGQGGSVSVRAAPLVCLLMRKSGGFALSYRISGGKVGNGQSPGGVILLKDIDLIEFITFVRG